MKAIFKPILIIIITLSSIFISAQNEVDALRFSRFSWEGTARFMGAGGAFGAVGGEFSALSTNPGSIGIFKRNEVSFTPLNITINQNHSTYQNETLRNNNTSYCLSNAGVVFVMPGIKDTKMKHLQLAFGYNRIANFNNVVAAEGYYNGSIAEVYAENAYGLDLYDFENWSTESQFAWNSWMIEPSPTDPHEYYSPLRNVEMLQSYYRRTTGGIDEMTFSFGGNYNDKVYYGFTIGVPIIKYNELTSYTEKDEYDQDPIFNEMTVESELDVKGSGVNLKLGVLFQPADFVRFGLALHTPTWYGKLSDNYYANYFSTGDSGRVETSQSNYYQYRLSTPLRAMFNTAFFIKKRAFISAEYEICNYAMATLSSRSYSYYSFKDENAAITDKYGISHIVRVGTEINCTSNILIRAGYIFKSSPYQKGVNDGAEHTGTVGLGFRSKVMFADIAYQLSSYNEDLWFYNPEFVNPSHNDFLNHKVIFTIGAKF